MGKNKINVSNKVKSGNPIYKKAGVSHTAKTKSKTKPVKTNLQKLKLGNKKATEDLDKKVDTFRQAVSNSLKKSVKQPPTGPRIERAAQVDVDMAVEELAKL